MSLYQALVCAVLSELGLQHIPGAPGICGGPSQWKVTDATLDHIKLLVGKTMTIEGDGKMTVK